MAGTPSGITNQSLDMILSRDLAKPLNRATAAMLTLAFEVRKADHLARGEKINEEDLKEEIKRTFYDFEAVTDVDVAMAHAQQKLRQQPKP